MIIKTADFKNICSTILSATDSNELSTLTETLELKAKDKVLVLSVTNGEYFISVNFPLSVDDTLNASVNANLFLKLINAVTTEDISLEAKDSYLEVKANGTYKIPYIYEGDHMLTLPEITIGNPTLEMNISGDTLKSILDYNSKELLRGTISRPVQKLYYMDEEGCITFTSGACVNSFKLEKPIRILFNDRLVKLFKLFKDTMVRFTLGYDPIDENLTQTKVRFQTPTICLTAITGCTDDLLNSIPVPTIRGRAEFEYPYNIVFNTEELREAVNRLLLFSAGYGSIKNLKPYSDFEFSNNKVMIYDSNRENSEEIIFKNSETISESYSMKLDLADLRLVLDNIQEDYITLSFGNHQAAVIKSKYISNIIPECKSI